MNDRFVQEPIAVIGIGCRFPGKASNPQAFWHLLLTGQDAVGEVPRARWDTCQYYYPDPTRPGKTYQRHGAFLEQVDQFDAAFFGISAVEASQLDPQQRLLLEISYEACEDAGLPQERLRGSATGVFVGICSQDYALIHRDPMTINAYTCAGETCSIAANRLSYFFDWHGPSLSVDTACSSSLVAVHLACQSLWKGECSQALAGGVNVLLDPLTSIGFSKAQMLSASGRCFAFDGRADGFVRGEGAGVVLLKMLSRAEAEGDSIYAVIRATHVNQDGRTQNLHYPGQSAQEALLRDAYTQAGIDLAHVFYIEAHGTGTIAGDQVECRALSTIFVPHHSPEKPLRIGSVKTNVGHLEAASGMAGLLKTLLLLRHRQIPATLHFQQNPHIPFDELFLKVQTAPEKIPESVEPLIAGVNSFGFGGTNAHVVVQAYKAPHSTSLSDENSSGDPLLLLLSAKTPQALDDLAQAYQVLLSQEDPPNLGDVCFTASRHRTHYQERLAVVATSSQEACVQLADFYQRRGNVLHPGRHSEQHAKRDIAFVFSGNGSQWWGMGRTLLQRHALFRAEIERCDHYWRSLAGWSIMKELLADEQASRIALTEVAQPALFALQVALAAVLRTLGIEPTAVIGHSVGEIAAAYVAGILSFEDALTVVYHRSRLQALTSGKGTMVAVGIPPQQAEKLIAPFVPHITLAAINSPRSVTLSGDRELLYQITEPLAKQQIFCRFLQLNYAFHSAQMEVLHSETLTSLELVKPQMARITFISTVMGREIAGTECTADYWWQNIRQPVLFADGIQCLLDQENTVFLEIGPHPVLSTYVQECLSEQKGFVLSSLRRGGDDMRQLLTMLAALYMQGYNLCWDQVVPQGRRIQLPTYPWQRERHWRKLQENDQHMRGSLVHPLLGYRMPTALTIWENTLDTLDLEYLFDHQVGEVALFPAAGYNELLLAAASQGTEPGSFVLEHVRITSPVFLHRHQPARFQTTIEADEITIRSYDQEQQKWLTCAIGQLSHRQPAPLETIDLAELRKRCPRTVTAKAFYTLFQRLGFGYGPAFQLVQQVLIGEGEALGMVLVPKNSSEQDSAYVLHPAFMDCCLQVLAAASFMQEGSNEEQEPYLPVRYDRLRFWRRPSPSSYVYSYARLRKRGLHNLVADYRVYDENGTLLVELSGLHLQASVPTKHPAQEDADELLYQERWYSAPLQSEPWSLPAPNLLHTEAQEQGASVSEEFSFIRFSQRLLPDLNNLCVAALLNTFRRLGWELSVGEYFTPELLCERLLILPRYEALLRTWCRFLEDQGILVKDDDGWRVLYRPAEEEPLLLLGRLTRLDPDHHAAHLLLTNCLPHLAQILQGKVNPRELLFPDGDMSRLEQLFTHDSMLRLCNSQTQRSIQRLLTLRPTHHTLRILEVGAGTGGTTSHLLPLLPAEHTQYVFSDVSNAFLLQARKRYQSYPHVEYCLFDLEQAPQSQGLSAHSFDLVIASNVVHTTRDLRHSLKHIRELLSPTGLLYLTETTNPFFVLDLLAFGLLEEFWSFQDYTVRPHSPLLIVARWKEELAFAGFSDPVILSPLPETGHPEQTVFLTQSMSPSSREIMHESSATQRQTLLMLADEQGIAEQLGAQLASDHTLIWVKPGASYQQVASEHFIVRSCNAEDLQRVLSALRQAGNAPSQVVYLWGLLDQPEQEPDGEKLLSYVNRACLNLLTVVQTLVEQKKNTLSRLWVVTNGVQHGMLACGEGREQGITQFLCAPLYGLTRVLANEHPELKITIVDLSSTSSMHEQSEEITTLAREIGAAVPVSEVCLRGSERFLNRVERASWTRLLRADTLRQDQPDLSFRLTIDKPGLLSRLALRAVPRRQLERGEVAIEVVAASLNFKDVAIAMGLISADVFATTQEEYPLGLECAGRIAAVGEGVSGFQPGDEVIAIGPCSFSDWLVVDERYVIRKPEQISMQAAAGILCVFLTAYYALHELAHIRAGERVLIHGAAGGVGLAAIQIVQQAGGEIFATAGTEEKRTYLRALGVRHVFESRSLAFIDGILQQTGGEGVDIVLNSVAGETATRSLELLRSFGRFLEIGKRDFQEHGRLRLHPFERCLTYHSIDLGRLLTEMPDMVKGLMRELMEHFAHGHYMPLPYHLYPLNQTLEAFRFMQQSRQIGKIVIQIQGQFAPVQHRLEVPELRLRQDGSYLITGGLGGFGLATARFLVAHGARHLILASRRGRSEPEDAPTIEQFRQAGVQVMTERLDVTSEQEVAALFSRIEQHVPPLRGIVHAAMVLSDQEALQMDRQSWERVLAPKMLGAWHLHRQSRDLPLDFFVCYSSISVLLGSVHQSNYVAGNAFLEALARYRRAHTLPALTISWGALAQVGYVARQKNTSDYLHLIGLQKIAPHRALELLEKIMQTSCSQAIVARIHWNRLTTYYSHTASSSRWVHLCTQVQDELVEGERHDAHTVLNAMVGEARQSAVLASLQQLMQQIGGQHFFFDPSLSLKEFGIDSLMAMELRMSLKQHLGVDIPLMQLLQLHTIADLAHWIAQQLERSEDEDQSQNVALTTVTMLKRE